MTGKEHNKLVSIFLLVHAGLQIFGVIIATLIYGGLGTAMLVNARREEEQMIGGIFIALMFVAVLVSLLFVVPQIVGGWKMLKEKSSARLWGIIASFVCLISIPFGTAVGIYGLWFLFGEGRKRFYLSGGNAASSFPPPNNWQ
jgi:cation transport ATPase